MVGKELLLTVKAIDQATATLKKTSGAIADTGSKAESSGDQLAGMGVVAKALGGVLAGVVTIQTVKAAYAFGKLGAQSLRTKRDFEAISGGASLAAENLDAMSEATRGAMSRQEMMTAANQLMQMGLADTAEELGTVSEMATRLGSAMGKDAGESMEAFTLMLANQSIPRLDTFGISAGAVRARMKELAAEFPEMSKEVRFMTATMEEGQVALENLGPAMDDDLLAAERLEASMDDLQMMAAELLAPAMGTVAETLIALIQPIIDARDEMDELTRVMGEGAVEAAELADQQALLAGTGDTLRDASMLLGQELEVEGGAVQALERDHQALTEQIAAGKTPMDRYTASANLSAGALDGVAESSRGVAKAFGEMTYDDEQLWRLALASGASTEALAALAKILGIATDEEIQMTLEGYKWISMFEKGEITAEELEAKFSSLETQTLLNEGAFEGLSAEEVILEKRLGDLETQTDSLDSSQRDVMDRTREWDDLMRDDHAAALLISEEAAADLEEQEDLLEEAKRADEEATRAQIAAEDDHVESLYGLDADVKDTIGVTKDFTEAQVAAALETLGFTDELDAENLAMTDLGTNTTMQQEQMAGDFETTQKLWRDEMKTTMELGTQVLDGEVRTIIDSVQDLEDKVEGSGQRMSAEFYESHPGLQVTAEKLGDILGTVLGIAGDHEIHFYTYHHDEPAPSGPEPSYPEYQRGTAYVPRTGYAYLHRGEAVIPATENRANVRHGDVYSIQANYAFQSERRLRDDIRMMQLMQRA